jgi:transposase-like protein
MTTYREETKKKSEQDIRDLIEELEGQIDASEDTDPAYLNSHLRELRHRTFYVHGAIERGIEILIAKDVVPDLIDSKSVEEDEGVFAQRIKIYDVLQNVSFSRKLSLAVEKKLISNKTATLFRPVNLIRNEFAHPDPFKIKRYTDEDLTLDVLRKLQSALNELNVLFSKKPITP